MQHPDITVYGPGQNPILSAEVLAGVGAADSAWIADFREQMFSGGFEPTTNYFLLVLPDKAYLWKNATAPGSKPDFEFDIKALLQPMLGNRDVHQLSEQALIMAVYGWLDDLTSSLGRAVNNKEYEWLTSSGLYDVLKRNSSMLLIETRS